MLLLKNALNWSDSNGADFQLGGLGDGVVTRTCENVDLGLGEAEGREDGAFWALFCDLNFDFDFTPATGHFDS